MNKPVKMEKTMISELIKGEVFQIVPGSDWYEYLGFWGRKFHYSSFDGYEYESDEMKIFAYCSRFNLI